MEKLKSLVFEKMQITPSQIKRIGGGFYADVFKFDYDGREPIIVKVYKSKRVMDKELSEIKLLSKHSLYPMPEILWVHNADEIYSQDIMTMNFLEGENGGNVYYLSSSKRAKLAEQVIDNLLAFHNVHNPDGFGETDADKYYKTFNEYYRQRAASILKMAEELHKKKELSDYVYEVVRDAVKQFDKIFYLPITEASLVHGDYNMWNIIVDKKQCKVTAIIDPCGCMWADNEYDLYQLNNANGKHLKLLELYSKKKALSENCRQKMAFYELFTEIEHYYKSGYPIQHKRLKKQADSLKNAIEQLEGLC